MKRLDCGVAVIGAGPAGLAAAISASDAGPGEVVLIERATHQGGILQQCIHNGFGVSLLGEDLTGPEYAERFITEAEGRDIRFLMGSMVIELTEEREITVVSPTEGLLAITAGSIVLAMGCRERTRGAIAIPGHRPAGIMTAGTAQRFINVEGRLPGTRYVILGSGDIGMIMARRLHLEGCRVEAVVEYQDCVGGLSRNLVQCLQDFDIPLHLNHTVTDIYGTERVEGVEICPLDRQSLPDRSKATTFDCDTLLLSVGLIPENELSKQCGILLDPRTSGPVVDETYQTSVPGIFAAGNVLQVFDLVDDVTRCGTRAGAAAARFAGGARSGSGGQSLTVLPGAGIRSVVPQRVSPSVSEPVIFHMRSTEVRRRTRLSLVDSSGAEVFRRRLQIVRPPEMFNVAIEGLADHANGELTFQLTGDDDETEERNP